MYHSISFGIGLQVFVYSDSLIKCFNEPCAHAPDVRIMIRWPRESPQMIFQWNDFLNALLGFLICVLEKTGTVYICWNKPPGIKQIYWINSQLKIKLTWYQSLYKGSHLYGTFNFFFQLYSYRVNHSVTLFFHGALLQSKIYRYKEHTYTHP